METENPSNANTWTYYRSSNHPVSTCGGRWIYLDWNRTYTDVIETLKPCRHIISSGSYWQPMHIRGYEYSSYYYGSIKHSVLQYCTWWPDSNSKQWWWSWRSTLIISHQLGNLYQTLQTANQPLPSYVASNLEAVGGCETPKAGASNRKCTCTILPPILGSSYFSTFPFPNTEQPWPLIFVIDRDS